MADILYESVRALFTTKCSWFLCGPHQAVDSQGTFFDVLGVEDTLVQTGDTYSHVYHLIFPVQCIQVHLHNCCILFQVLSLSKFFGLSLFSETDPQ